LLAESAPTADSASDALTDAAQTGNNTLMTAAHLREHLASGDDGQTEDRQTASFKIMPVWSLQTLLVILAAVFSAMLTLWLCVYFVYIPYKLQK
jgi:hypothetical protein